MGARHVTVDEVACAVLTASVGALDDALACLRSARSSGDTSEAPDPSLPTASAAGQTVAVAPTVEQIHRARVASRRLRVHVRALTPEFGLDRADMATDLIGNLARSLGSVRDLDVMGHRLTTAADRATWPLDPAGWASVLDRHGEARSDALVHAWTTLDRFDAGGAHALLIRLTQIEPDRRDAQRWAEDLAVRHWRSLRRAVAAGDLSGTAIADGSAGEQLHRIRLRAKRLRYLIEAFEGQLGARAAKVASATARFTDAIGSTRDATAASRWLAELAERHPECGFVAGRLAELVTADSGESDALPECWAAVRTAVVRVGW